MVYQSIYFLVWDYVAQSLCHIDVTFYDEYLGHIYMDCVYLFDRHEKSYHIEIWCDEECYNNCKYGVM